MTNKILGFFTIAAIFTSCVNNSNPGEKQEVKTSSACYRAVNEKDSINLHIIVNGNAVTGELTYNLFEKDKNTGSIQGEVNGDTIIATYNFMSEGTQSKREVVFLKKGNDLVEGFGPVEDKDGKVSFTNRSALVFNAANTLTKTNCAATPAP